MRDSTRRHSEHRCAALLFICIVSATLPACAAATTDGSSSDVIAVDTNDAFIAHNNDSDTAGTSFDGAASDASPAADISAQAADATAQPLYFPPTTGSAWATTTLAAAGFKSEPFADFVDYVGSQNSTALIVLHRGKIVVEKYWSGWNVQTSEAMYSATKSVTSVLIGIALTQGLFKLDDTVTSLLGPGWSGASKAQEAEITVRHLMTMTSGLQDKAKLGYVAKVGTAWDYNTKAYYVLGDILEKVTGSRTAFTTKVLWQPIGMQQSAWVNLFLGTVKTMRCSARDMARFGLLVLAKGQWAGKSVVSGGYLAQATEASQSLNPAYGLLFWLNGSTTYRLPKKALASGAMIPTAPADMVSALGAQDKKIYVVPSLDLVVIRHGPAANEGGLAGSSFDIELWKRLMLAVL